ncbi:MAG: hypothetical protein BroJett021_21670 [Chloroflexota bacterium]|nr:hypothetical protein [Caldilinea sp.]GIK73179.1 MAG: hypothetical protein BroJett021_21670 [Chloroflexota bacterium]
MRFGKKFTRTALCFVSVILLSLLWRHHAAAQSIVVGDGTPESCDNNALGAALISGGDITFACGSAPHTIIADTYVIATDTVLDGGGLITLDGENLRRIFIVQDNAHLTLRNITLTRGFASDGPGGAIWNFGVLLIQNSTLSANGTDTVFAGGAIASFSPGEITIEQSVFDGNSAADGGAIYTYGAAAAIRSSIFRNNVQRVNGGYYGGGAILQEVNDNALLTITDSEFQNNASNPSGAVGGAISLLTGRMVIEESTFLNNVGYGGGGALYLAPNTRTEIRRSRLIGNRTELSVDHNFIGGAIDNHGDLVIEDSLVSENQATDGAGIFSGGQGSLTLRRSTVSQNQARGGGGGLLLFPGVSLIENSTISGNRATIGAGIRSGVTVGEGSVTLRHVTLYGNASNNLYVDDGSQPVLVRWTILGGIVDGVNCNAGAPLVSGGRNLSSDESCNLGGNGDIVGVAPLLAALANNGGATATHLPFAGSPAIDAGGDECLPTDQRGVTRPQGAACDIGAVEVTDDDATPMPPFEHAEIGGVKPTITVNPAQGYAGQSFTVQGNAAGASAVRVAWSQNGQVLTIAERSVGANGAYSIDLSVPTGMSSGSAEICAAVAGQTLAEFACAPFTVLDAPAAIVSGVLPAGVVGAGNVAVHLLDAAGNTLYSTAVDNTGRFSFAATVPAGFYNYAVVGAPTTNIAGGIANLVSGVNTLTQDRFTAVNRQLDPCIFKDANTGAFSATPSHRTFKSLITSAYVSGIRSSMFLLPRNTAAESNYDDVYFGIYMTGAPLTVQFTASPQVTAGQSIASVRFTIVRADNNAAIVIGNDATAPYQASFNVGALPAGQHDIKAEALNASGAVLSTMCKSLVVVGSILPSAAVSTAAVDEMQKTVEFFPNPTNPEKGYYRVRGFVPAAAERAWPPAPIPNPPPQWPLIGTVDNRVGLRMEFDIEMALDGELRFRFVRSDIYAKLLGTELCNNSRDLLARNYTTRFNYLKPQELSISLNGGTLCSFNTGRSLFRGQIESLWGLLSFGIGIRTHYDGSMSFVGSLQPMAMNIQTAATGYFNPSLIVDGWVKLFWGVAGGGVTPRADIVSMASANINTKVNPPYSYVACAAVNVWVNVWARVNYLFGSKTWNLWNKSLLSRSTCLQAAEALASQAHDDPPPPRVMAAPAIASGDGGQMITVYVEDTAPAAPVARAQIMARFRSSDAKPWGDPIALTDGAHMVQDPTVVFYNGDKAIVAWTETVMTPEEDAAATELSQVLSRQEIFYALWDGAQWGASVRFTDDAAADGSATLASLGRRVTLAWVRDLDGNPATRTDWRIATAQLDGEVDQWITAYLLDAAQSIGASSAGQATAGGMNAEVKLAYDAAAVDPTVYAAWTFDGDGELNTGLDRRVIVARWNVVDEVALNPQPLPPRDWAALNPQPLPPRDWALLNPQPLPPRTQSPTISIAEGNVRLAFLVNEPDAAGDETPITLGGDVWVAHLAQDGATWQAMPLRDERGAIITGEAPVFANRGDEQLLLFRRFGDAQTAGALGQLSLSRVSGVSAPTTPIYLTNTPQQQWQGALAINQISGIAQIVKVARIGVRDVQAASTLAPATPNSTMQVQTGLLSVSSDPVETIQVATGADPALDPLQISQRAAPAGTPVEVIVVVRNVGRGLATGLTINLYSGQPGAGVLQGSATAPLPLNLNESYAARFTIMAPTGAGDIYAEVTTSGENLSTANDRVVAQLGKPSAPLLVALSEDAIFDGNLRLDWLPSPGEAIAGYRVYRSASANGQYEFVGESGQFSYVDLLSQRNIEYCYRVRAYASGSILSDVSAPLCAKLGDAPATERSLYLPLINH